MTALGVEVKFAKPREGPICSRWGELKIDGVTIFAAEVYDSTREGVRSEETATRNLLLSFASALRRAGVKS